MKKMKRQKFECDYCKKKVVFKPKRRVIEGLHYHFLKCGSCGTVFPSYVINNEVSENIQEIKTLQREMRYSPVPKTDKEADEAILANKKRVQRILELKRYNDSITKKLVKDNISVFEKFGERTIVNW